MVVVILNGMVTECVIEVEQKPDTSPIFQLYVTSCTHLTLTRLRLKFYKLEYCYLDGFLGIIGQ